MLWELKLMEIAEILKGQEGSNQYLLTQISHLFWGVGHSSCGSENFPRNIYR